MLPDSITLNLLKSLRQWWSPLPVHVKVYCLGGVALVPYVALIVMQKGGDIQKILAVIFAVVMSVGFVLDLWRLGEIKIESLFVKLVSGVITFIVASLATVSSTWIVNEATGQDPGYFKLAIAIIAPFSFCALFLFAAISLIGLVSLVVSLLIVTVKEIRDKGVWGGKTIWYARLLASVSVMFLAAAAQGLLSRQTNWLKNVAAAIAYGADMHVDPACGPTPGDRVARISDELVILGRITADGARFKRHACALAEEQDATLPSSVL